MMGSGFAGHSEELPQLDAAAAAAAVAVAVVAVAVAAAVSASWLVKDDDSP